MILRFDFAWFQPGLPLPGFFIGGQNLPIGCERGYSVETYVYDGYQMKFSHSASSPNKHDGNESSVWNRLHLAYFPKMWYIPILENDQFKENTD